MTFACVSGTVQVSGQLSLACGQDGQLIGDPVVCQGEP